MSIGLCGNERYDVELGILESDWRSYKRVQESGKYNMLIDASKAAEAVGVSLGKYCSIIGNYRKLEWEFDRDKKWEIEI